VAGAKAVPERERLCRNSGKAQALRDECWRLLLRRVDPSEGLALGRGFCAKPALLPCDRKCQTPPTPQPKLQMAYHALLQMFALLLVAHAVADYPLQGEFLSRAKNRQVPMPGVPWYQALAAHGAIHGGAVGWITGSIALGLLETLSHMVIDDLKCAHRISYNLDQALHVACKVLWLLLLQLFGPLP